MNAWLIALICFGVLSCAASRPDVPECSIGLEPETKVSPVLPTGRMHSEFEGYALVEFVVSTDGVVLQPKLLDSEWKAVGRAAIEPDGYDEAVLTAVAQWLYAPVQVGCLATHRLEIIIGDSASVSDVPFSSENEVAVAP